MKKVIATDKAPAAIGPYSQAVEANGFLFISGQVPINPESGSIEATNIEGQTNQAMKNIGAILQEAGLNYSHVVKTTCLLTDLSEFKAFNEVYGKYFSSEPPARATFEVSALPLGAKVEIEVVAAK